MDESVPLQPSRLKVCIFGTHHAYQYKTVRRKYFEGIAALIQMHSVDLVAEEATGMPRESYAKGIAHLMSVVWRNVDLTGEERALVEDVNTHSLGAQIDFDLHSLREWVWVIRTAKAMKKSALLICGLAHTTGIADKFWSLGFDVETHVFFDNTDDKLFSSRAEPNLTASTSEPAANSADPIE